MRLKTGPWTKSRMLFLAIGLILVGFGLASILPALGG